MFTIDMTSHCLKTAHRSTVRGEMHLTPALNKGEYSVYQLLSKTVLESFEPCAANNTYDIISLQMDGHPLCWESSFEESTWDNLCLATSNMVRQTRAHRSLVTGLSGAPHRASNPHRPRLPT